MKTETIQLIVSLVRLLTIPAALYLGYQAAKQGWFYRNQWKCPHKGCKFRVAIAEWNPVFDRIRDDHLIKFHEGRAE